MGLTNSVHVITSVLRSGWDKKPGEDGVAELAANEAYEEAGIGPEDLSVIELHDASAPAEIMAYESLGLCGKGEGGMLISDGVTKLGGRLPVNTSGGLLRKGHPVGATGIAQIVELTEQLQGRCGDRQVGIHRLSPAAKDAGPRMQKLTEHEDRQIRERAKAALRQIEGK